jgi:hypothetical protein
MSEPTLDWSSAEVKDSTLTVEVEGDLPDGWEDTFKATVQLLGGGSWGEIKLEEQKAEVSGLTPGTEEKLRHFLESVVQQANATHHTDEDEEQKSDEEGEEEGEDSEEESEGDKQMTERFRSFGEDGDSKDEDSRDEESKNESEDDSSE